MLNLGLNSASFLAQVNFGTNSASILGIFLAVSGAALYFLRTVKPELSRDQDIFFAAVGLLCGFILIFQGWRLDPILQFGQLLLVGSTVFFAVESIRLRGIATEQAKRNTRIVDDDRRVSDNYRYEATRVDAELEQIEPEYYDDEPTPRPRIRPSRDSRSGRDDYYGYEDETPRRSERRSSSGDRSTSREKPRNKRSSSRPASRSSDYTNDEWDSSQPTDEWSSSTREERKPRRPSSNGSSRPESSRPERDSRNDEEVAPKPRKRRPKSDVEARRPQIDEEEPITTDYEEYKPITQPDDDADNSANFDDDI